MRKLELSTIGYMILFITLVLLFTHPAKAQDSQVTSCYTRTEVGAVFTFSNIPDRWLEGMGWYYIGDAVQLNDHTLTVTGLQFDEGYSYAIVGAGDYSENETAATDTAPLCGQTPMPPVQNAPMPSVALKTPIVEAVVSTGRTCTIQYPKIILVCG